MTGISSERKPTNSPTLSSQIRQDSVENQHTEMLHQSDNSSTVYENKTVDSPVVLRLSESSSPTNDELCGEESHQLLWQKPSKVSVLSTFTTSNLFKIQVNIGGSILPLIALVDTGSNRSLINHKALPTDTNVSFCDDIKIYGVAEEKGIKACGMANLELSVAGRNMQMISFVVLPHNFQLPVDIVLGVDFLKTNQMSINIDAKMLSVVESQGIIDIFFDADGLVRQKAVRNIICTVASSVHLPPLTTTEVFLNLPTLSRNNNYDILLIEDHVSRKMRSRVSCLPGVMNSGDSKVRVLLSNCSDSNVHLKYGTAVGTARSVVNMVDTMTAQSVQPNVSKIVENVDLKHLNDGEATRVRELLTDFSAIFHDDDNNFEASLLAEHKIELLNDTPIYQRPRRLPGPAAEEIEAQCRELRDLGVIEPSASAWSSPIVPIRKKDGGLRLCVDYRALNKVTKADKFPLPNLTDSVYGLHGVKYLSKIDLTRGFYQTPLHKDSREYTAFSTPLGHWQFNRLSFGMKNGPGAFQRGLSQVLSIFPWKKVIVYVDDILIMETSFERHFELVSQVLATLAKYKLKIRPDKCEWFKNSVEFLGHVVSHRGLSKTKSYLDRVNEYPRPENVRQLREFLGLVNFQRKFIAGCSELQKPLSCLTGGSKSKKLVWTPEMEHAFESLKGRVREDIELAFPDYSPTAEKLQLWVDASDIGGGACVTQVQDGELRIIAFASMSFEAAQKNYSVLEKELAALRWGVKSFRALLYATEFELRTDHQALVYLNNMKMVDSRLARTLEDLSDFNFVIKYTPGRLNTAADALSRLPSVVKKVDDEFFSASPQLPYGLLINGSPVQGGGNSLFESLIVVLREALSSDNVPTNHIKLRELLIDELARSPSRYNIRTNKVMRRDLKLMRLPNQLPCLEVLLVASEMFNVNIHVYFWSQNPVVYSADLDEKCDKRTVVHLQCISGVHFNPLIASHSYNDSKVAPSCVVSCDLPRAKSCGEVMPSAPLDNDDDFEELSDTNMMQCNVAECEHSVSDRPVVILHSNQNKICALLDTGAEVSLICESVLPSVEYNNMLLTESVSVMGVSGKMEDVTRIVEINFAFSSGDTSIKHVFLVVNDSAIPCCVLLGADLMTKYLITLDFDHSLCNVKSLNIVLPFMKESIVNSCTPYVGIVELKREQVCTLFVGPPTSSVALQLQWNDNEVSSISSMFSDEVLRRMQKRTPQLRKLKRCVGKNPKNWPRALSSFKRHASYLSVVDEVLMYQNNDRSVPVISFGLMVEIILVLHHQLAHIGRDKILGLVSDQFFHPSIRKVADDICTTCEKCQLYKVRPMNVLPPTVKIVTNRPFELVAMDLIQFGTSSSGYVACLMVIDHNSKWLAAVPIRNKKSETVIAALEKQVLPFLPRQPERILCDNGGEFSSFLFKEFVRRHGIALTYSTPWMPSCNGAVERVNRTIKSFLATLTNTRDWDSSLPLSIVTYNNTLHREIGMSPAKYLLCQQHDLSIVPPLSSDISDKWKAGSPHFSPFSVGQKVIRKVPVKGNLNIDKFKPRYDGPYIIRVAHKNNVAYEIEDCQNSAHRVRAHYTQLREWKSPPHYLTIHPYYGNIHAPGVLSDECVEQEQISPTPSHFYSFCIPVTSSSDESSYTSDDEDNVSNYFPINNPDLPVIVQYCLYDIPAKVTDKSPIDFNCRNENERTLDDPTSSFAVLDRHNETWEMSSISREDLAEIQNSDLIPDINNDCFGNAVQSVLVAADAALSSVESFLEECHEIIEVSLTGVGEAIDTAHNESLSPTLLNLRKLRAATLKDLELVSSKRAELNSSMNQPLESVQRVTRSRGKVLDLPHVQSKILERKGNY